MPMMATRARHTCLPAVPACNVFRTTSALPKNYQNVALALFGLLIGFTLTMCFLTLKLAVENQECGVDKIYTSAMLPSIPAFLLTSGNDAARVSSGIGNFFADTEAESSWVPESAYASVTAARTENKARQLLLVGIMTARKYLNSRAETINRTWARTVPGRVKYFVGTTPSDQIANMNLPLTALPVDDAVYPPQKKSFLMLKHMWEHHGNEFDWFMRADDDVYIRGNKLEKLLRSVNSSQALYLGQTGLGNKAEYGHLSLGDSDNYCMGGTGMIFSRETLKRLAPFWKNCLQNLYTTHEDVEVGRCVRRYARASCTWAYEMQQIFQNKPGQQRSPVWQELVEPSSVVTLHPVKEPRLMQGTHLHFKRLRTASFRYRYVQVFRDFAFAGRMSGKETYHPVRTLQEFASIPHLLLRNSDYGSSTYSTRTSRTWNFMSPSLVYCAQNVNCPRHSIPSQRKAALHTVEQEILLLINQNSRQKGRLLEFRELLYGYFHKDPVRGSFYILDMLLLYKKFKGKRLTTPVRRHAYVQQMFARPEASLSPLSLSSVPFLSQGVSQAFDDFDSARRVDVIIPLTGRLQTLRKFLKSFRAQVLEARENISLTLVLNGRDEAFIKRVSEEISVLKSVYPRVNVTLLRLLLPPRLGNFSRGYALAKAAERFADTDLLLLTDIDVVFTRFALQRVRKNTLFRRQVYFPVVFSEYAPRNRVMSENRDSYQKLIRDEYSYATERGSFRHFGFGIVSIYSGDLRTVGSYNLDITGWGLEDVDLYDKILKFDGQKSEIHNGANFSVLRSTDPGFVHVYHKVECTPGVLQQYKMCLGSKAANFASLRMLSGYVFHNIKTNPYFQKYVVMGND